MTSSSLPRNQRSNTSPATRLKAERLTIITINDREAYIEGDTDVYLVQFRSLTCSCPAGMVCMHCSHVLAAVKERARMQGFEHTAFSPNAQHMEAYAAMQRKAGKRAVEHVANGYFYVCSGRQPVDVPRPRRTPEQLAAAVESLFS